MDLVVRPFYVEDIEFAVRHTRDAFAYSIEEQDQLHALLHALFVQEAAWGEVLEDRNFSTQKPQSVYYLLFVCVTDAFAQWAKNEMPPFVLRSLIHRQNAGDRVLQDADEIRGANSADGAGLKLLCISGGPAALLDFPTRSEIIGRFPEWVLSSIGGFNLKELFWEAFGMLQYDWAVSFGFLLRTDYADHYQEIPVPPERHPYLFNLTLQEAQDAVYGSVAARLFYYVPPVYFFRPHERDVLLHALHGFSDEQIALRLSVSVSAIHKRWKGIYQRVKSVSGARLLPEAQEGRRGSENKTRLLDYVRRHPEELRPSDPPEAP